MSLNTAISIFLLSGLVLWAWPRPAAAYLDPGSGSLMIQIAVAAVLGALLTIKLWLRNALYFLRKLAPKKQKNKPPPDTDQ